MSLARYTVSLFVRGKVSSKLRNIFWNLMLFELAIECRFCFLCRFLIVVSSNDVLGQVTLAAIRMNLVSSQSLFDGVDLILPAR